jgi:thioredoxin-like negative regulator of GroEL
LAEVDELEKYTAAHPESMDSRFLLAYHSVVKGDQDHAERLLESVRATRPKDRVVLDLLAALRGQTSG